MAIANYNDLLVAAANWLARDDLASRIPEFVTLAEAACNREFRVRAMEQRAQAGTVAGQVFYTWPTDLLEVRSIKLAGDPPAVLTYLSPEQMESQGSEAGPPRYWSDIQAALRLWPAPTAGLTIEIDYYQRLDLAAAGDDGNWLIRRHPDIYLYGTLLQAEPYLMNDARAQTWVQLLNAAVDQMQREDWRIKAGVMPAMVRTEYRGA
ncbi:MAG: hypothetical protein IT563_09755 [Alphaproteobacteria bacterium]|nr:hypothetical protein [Alphaproteobacteria bacterium]